VSYQINITRDAAQEINHLAGSVRTQARQIIRSLADAPRPPRSTELRDMPGIYRIWLAGRWRIVYQVDDTQQLVTILRVRLKDDIDYGSLRTSE
jgi:mRNA-degrading endonuclease RelE of RelBE toxin-antitoxin system